MNNDVDIQCSLFTKTKSNETMTCNRNDYQAKTIVQCKIIYSGYVSIIGDPKKKGKKKHAEKEREMKGTGSEGWNEL